MPEDVLRNGGLSYPNAAPAWRLLGSLNLPGLVYADNLKRNLRGLFS